MSTKIEKNWEVSEKINKSFIDKYSDLNLIILQLLFNRGFTERKDIDKFLSPDFEKDIYDPFLFNNIKEAVDLIIFHIKNQDKIVIYGDYDADGVSSSALLFDILTRLKAKVDVYLPDRVSEGYGLNKNAINEFIKDNIKLIITVDGGIRNKEEVEYAKEKGVEIIITDHHVPPDEKKDLPDCLIINALVEGEKYPYKFLSGVGVALKLAEAIIFKSKLSEDDKKKLRNSIMDLAAIGTVADCVSLLGENRVLVKKGLEVLNNTKRVGLLELFKEAKIENRKLDSWNIGFQIAPRLNAAGRMDHANTALELLITKDKDEAANIAKRLNSKNIERQKITEEIVESIINQVEKKLGRKRQDPSAPPPVGGSAQDDKVIFAVTPDSESWKEGVIGLVAGRITERFYLPTLVLTKADGGYKGSGRSIPEFNIIKALEECSELFEKYGGHPAACGFSFKEENLDKFKKKITEIANKELKDIELKPRIKIEKEINLDNIEVTLMDELEKFFPFGQGNEKPKFLSRNIEIANITSMGIDGQHIKIRLKKENFGFINAVGFGQSEKWKDLNIGDKIDIVFYIDRNEFRGRCEVQLKIIDIKLCLPR